MFLVDRYLMIRHTRKKKESEVIPTHTRHNPPPHTHRAHNLQKVASFDIFHPDNHILLGKDANTHTLYIMHMGAPSVNSTRFMLENLV